MLNAMRTGSLDIGSIDFSQLADVSSLKAQGYSVYGYPDFGWAGVRQPPERAAAFLEIELAPERDHGHVGPSRPHHPGDARVLEPLPLPSSATTSLAPARSTISRA